MSHHTVLHCHSTNSPSSTLNPLSTTALSPRTSEPLTMAGTHVATTSCLVRGQPQRIVLLSTAIVEVYAADGRRYTLRALLDSGSQASFITERSVCTLMLPRFHSSVSVSTFANSASTIVRGKCNIKMAPSGEQSPSFCFDVSIVPQITW